MTKLANGATRQSTGQASKQAGKQAGKAATPWGPAAVLSEVRVAQRAGDKRFASVFQLLEDARGDQLVRIAYSTDGVNRRGPVTLRAQDLARLHQALRKAPSLAEALGVEGVPA